MPPDIDKSIGDEKTLLRADATQGTRGYTLAPGQTLGQYKIIRALGRGGMGEVYEVEHEVIHRRFALKLLPSDFERQSGTVERFRREAQVMSKLDHPNIVKVDDFGETHGRHWLRMELATPINYRDREVISLQDVADARGGRLDQEKLTSILEYVLNALQYAHEQGVVHRDLKPSNILLFAGEDGMIVKIADFGLVRLVGEEWVRNKTQLSLQRSLHRRSRTSHAASVGDLKTMPGQLSAMGSSATSLLGTYEYMSPEQKRGDQATAQSDLYAVGLMAFRLLTGHEPGIKPPSKIDGSLASGWDTLIEKALEERVTERWSSVEPMRHALANVSREVRVLHQLRHGGKLPIRRVADHNQGNADDAHPGGNKHAREQHEESKRKSSLAQWLPAKTGDSRREPPTTPHPVDNLKTNAGRKRPRSGATGILVRFFSRKKDDRNVVRESLPADGKNLRLRNSRHRISKRGTLPVKAGKVFKVVLAVLGFSLVAGSIWWHSNDRNMSTELSGDNGLTLPVVVGSGSTSRHGGPVAGKTWTSPATGMEFVWIDEMKLWVGKFEVTNSEYRQKKRAHNSGSFRGHSLNKDRQPVVYVNFHDAQAYAEWMTQRDRTLLGELYYRLPTEREWMTFAQCGDGRVYPWGNEWPPVSGQAGNYSDITSSELSQYFQFTSPCSWADNKRFMQHMQVP